MQRRRNEAPSPPDCSRELILSAYFLVQLIQHMGCGVPPRSFTIFNFINAYLGRHFEADQKDQAKPCSVTFSGGVAIMYYLMTLNSAVNPFIYIAFNRELRRPLLRLFPFLTRYTIVVGYHMYLSVGWLVAEICCSMRATKVTST